MPRIGSIEIGLEEVSCCGAAFLTTRAFQTDLDIKTPECSLRAQRGTRWIVAVPQHRLLGQELLSTAITAAQMALDLLSCRGDFLELDTPNTDRLVWWSDENGCHLKAVHISRIDRDQYISLPRLDWKGGVQPSPVAWHPSMRFYRLAHFAEDPIERFRYLYLAIENAISGLSPKGKESERSWLKRVLREHKIDCAAVLLDKGRSQGDSVDQVVDLIYKQTRCPAFHAKKGESIFLPADLDALRAASSAGEVALRLLRRISGVMGGALGMSFLAQGGFELFTNHIAQRARIAFSGDARAFNPADQLFSDPQHPTTELPTQTSTDRFIHIMRGTLISPTERIGRIGLLIDGLPLSATHYEATLDTAGFADVKFILGVQMIQPGIDPMANLPM